jgi:hypothetical protein
MYNSILAYLETLIENPNMITKGRVCGSIKVLFVSVNDLELYAEDCSGISVYLGQMNNHYSLNKEQFIRLLYLQEKIDRALADSIIFNLHELNKELNEKLKADKDLFDDIRSND